MAAPEFTAKSLLDQHLAPTKPQDVLRTAVLVKYEELRKKGHDEATALQSLFPNTILDVPVLKKLTAALVSGANLLFLGPPGSGKTSLAKDVWDLYPKDILAVEDCPLQDDPYSLVDPKFAREIPACPHCKLTYGGVSLKRLGDFDPAQVDPAKVPVARRRLREGHGLSRIQGSPEVFPDNLTGAINLAKLEEIGDPNSPLVMEPGKVLQAHRGLLLVDEIGKLPRGTQNVLLQALQENIVSPAKSRETFPASFVALATSNLQDLDNVAEPLIGRLAIVFVDFNSDHAKNYAIVRKATRDSGPFTPTIFMDAAAGLIEAWRRTVAQQDELGEVGSNRTMIDIVRRAQAYAQLAARPLLTVEDYQHGSHEAMMGRIRARGTEAFQQNSQVVDQFVAKKWKESLHDAGVRYWCGFSQGVLLDDKAEALRTLDAVRNAVEGRPSTDGTKFEKFQKYVASRERLTATTPEQATQAVYQLLDSTGAFSEKG